MGIMKRSSVTAAVVWMLAMAAPVAADGLIVPIRPDVQVRGSWSVKYHHVTISVRDQVASVSIEQAFVNNGAGMIEVEYLFPVPPGAAVDSLTLKVDGKEFAAKLLKADEARAAYESIVRSKKDPALLEYAGYGMYRTKAFPLMPGKPAEVLVTYKGVCHKDRDLVEVWYPLNTEKYSAKPVESVQVSVDIVGRGDTLKPYSPTHDITVQRKAPDHVVVTYEAKNVLPTTDFQVYYVESNEKVGASLTTHQAEAGEDGYFMLLVSPNPRTSAKAVQAKDFVIAFDHSGSMSGKKIQQAREALAYVLNNLNPDDRFNVVSYNDSVDLFFPANEKAGPLVAAGAENIKRAQQTLDRVEASGGTNIAEAMQTALAALARGGNDRPKYILFLTDGIPTVGLTEEKDILREIKKANTCNARVFAFGVGYDVNVQLLERLINDNNGRSEYVKPAEPIEAKVSSLYNKVKNPVMTDLTLTIRDLGLKDIYPRKLGDLFDGDQIVVVGRYDAGDMKKLPLAGGVYQGQLTIKGRYEGAERAFEYPVTINPAGKDIRFAFVEKLWAMRRVGYLLDEINLNGAKNELVEEVTRLGIKYGIMTPYTSFLADERTNLTEGVRNALRAGEAIAKDFGGGGAGADAQRGVSNMQTLSRAEKSSPAATPAESGSFKQDAKGNAVFAPGGSAMVGHATREDYEGDKAGKSLETVRNVGQQAVYRRSQGQNQPVWIASNASDIDPARDQAKMRVVTRFSDEYFKLIQGNSADENRVLASQQADEELVMRMQGQVYHVK